MSSTKIYSVEEVLNLTVTDIQEPDFVDIAIEGWLELTPEERGRCISKLGELKNQRDELTRSSAVDANALTEKLNKVERSRSATPYNPYDPKDPSQMKEEQRREKASYEALINDNGRPCYPVELGFDVFENPGQYKDILEYWQRDKDQWSERLIFSAQLCEWEAFRRCQQRDRRYYVPRNWFHKFHEFLHERRRKHGLDGDVHLCEELADQSKLEDWMEYQNYELRELESLEQKLKEVQERLTSRRKALAEEGYSGFEEIEDIEFGKYYGMNRDWGEKEAKAKKKEELVERKLRITKTRLEAAQSEGMGENVERDKWIGWFVKEVELQRTRVDELKRLADEARRDVEPYDQWWEARTKEWAEMGSFRWTEEGDRLIELETSSAKHRTRFDKMQELNDRAHEAEVIHYSAEKEVEFAEELLEAARTEDLAQTVERAALIRRTQKEVRFAEFHLAEEKESTKVLDIKTLVLDDLYSNTSLKRRLRQHNVLLNWVEQQRQELVGDNASAGQRSGPRRSTRVSARAPHATEAFNVNNPVKKRVRLQKPSIAKSILDPIDPAKVNKASNKRRSPHRRTEIARHLVHATENTIIDSSTAEPGSEAAVPVKDGMCARLRPVHSSRVSKPTLKRPMGQRKQDAKLSRTRDTHRRTGKHPPGTSSASSREIVEGSMVTPPQRSARVSMRSGGCRPASR